MEPFDYRDMLRRYIGHIITQEGVDFLAEGHGGEDLFSADELAELRRISDGESVNGQHLFPSRPADRAP